MADENHTKCRGTSGIRKEKRCLKSRPVLLTWTLTITRSQDTQSVCFLYFHQLNDFFNYVIMTPKAHFLHLWLNEVHRAYTGRGFDVNALFSQTHRGQQSAGNIKLNQCWIMPIAHVNFEHMMTSSNGNIFRVTGPLCGEFTGPRWIPLKKASGAELWCFFDLLMNKHWVNNPYAGDLRRHRAYYAIIVMTYR